MTRRHLFGMLLGVLGVAVWPKPGGEHPDPHVPEQIWRDRYNDPPDQTLHQQIFS